MMFEHCCSSLPVIRCYRGSWCCLAGMAIHLLVYGVLVLMVVFFFSSAMASNTEQEVSGILELDR